jgi:hypothetical protein
MEAYTLIPHSLFPVLPPSLLPSFSIDEFGSLVSVTVTVTRKMITLFISIIMYKHTVHWWQWMGVASVFIGLCVKIFWGGGGHGHGAPAKTKTK